MRRATVLQGHPEAIRARLKEQVARLLETGAAFDPDRLHQEAIMIATSADIQEELDRLFGHIDSGPRPDAHRQNPLAASSIFWPRNLTARPTPCVRRHGQDVDQPSALS